MTVCVLREQKGIKNEENSTLFFFFASFFFSSQTGVCFCVVVKNTRMEYLGERAFCGRSLVVVLKRLLVKGEEGRSTLRLTMITTNEFSTPHV